MSHDKPGGQVPEDPEGDAHIEPEVEEPEDGQNADDELGVPIGAVAHPTEERRVRRAGFRSASWGQPPQTVSEAFGYDDDAPMRKKSRVRRWLGALGEWLAHLPWGIIASCVVVVAVTVTVVAWLDPWRKTTPYEELLSHMRSATSEETALLTKVGMLPVWVEKDLVFVATEDFTLPPRLTHVTIVVPEGVRWQSGTLSSASLIRYKTWDKNPGNFVRIYDPLCELERVMGSVSGQRGQNMCVALQERTFGPLEIDARGSLRDASEEELRSLLPDYDPKIDQRPQIFEGSGDIPWLLTMHDENEPDQEDWHTIVISRDASVSDLAGPLDRYRVPGVAQAVTDELCWSKVRPAFANAHPDTFAPADMVDPNCTLT